MSKMTLSFYWTYLCFHWGRFMFWFMWYPPHWRFGFPKDYYAKWKISVWFLQVCWWKTEEEIKQ